jgi:hypothetical protein
MTLIHPVVRQRIVDPRSSWVVPRMPMYVAAPVTQRS